MSNSTLDTFKPIQQLVVYSSGSEQYIEHYHIIDNKLSEASPLTKKTLKKLVDAVWSNDKTMFASVKCLMPENVLYYDPRPGKLKLIWYNKPMQRSISGIYKNKSTVKFPTVIYMLDDDKLHVFVSKLNKRPDLKTQLFHAPLPNVYNDGSVCMGSVKKPTEKIELSEVIFDWEAAFWNSTFTYYLHYTYKESLLKSAIKSKTTIPNRQLVSTKRTIQNLIR